MEPARPAYASTRALVLAPDPVAISERRWLVTGTLRGPTPRRAHHIMRSIVGRTDAAVIESGGGRALIAGIARSPSLVGANLVAAELLTTRVWGVVRRLVRPTVLDVHDHTAAQREALGIRVPARERRRMERVLHSVIADFPHVVAPTDSFADLCEIPRDRRIVISNGTNSNLIRPAPAPDAPVVGLAAGAAPNRGIEMLVDAMRLVRTSMPDARLELALAATSPQTAAYIERFRESVRSDAWIRVVAVPYARVAEFLAGLSVYAIPHPPNRYADVSAPLKLFDAMAAGRPVVTTPRLETARIVRESDAGVVTTSDHVDDLASSLLRVLGDREEARRLGDNGRRVAVERYDWTILAEMLADRVLGPMERRGGHVPATSSAPPQNVSR